MLTQPKSRILITGTMAASDAGATDNRRIKKRKEQQGLSVDKKYHYDYHYREFHQPQPQQQQQQQKQKQEKGQAKEVCSRDDMSKMVKKRKITWSALVSIFHKLRLPLVSLPETWLEFNHLGRHLRNKKVIQVISKILNVILNVTDKDGRKRSRVLLSAYMMTMCPREVFQNVHGSEEQVSLLSGAHLFLHFLVTFLKLSLNFCYSRDKRLTSTLPLLFLLLFLP